MHVWFYAGFRAFVSRVVQNMGQKNVLWMENIKKEFTIRGSLLADYCAGTISVALAYVLPPSHRLFARCNLDKECFTLSLQQLILVFSRQVPKKGSGVAGDDEVCQATFTIVKTFKELDLKRSVDLWKTSAGLSIIQTGSSHVRFPLSINHMSFSIFDQALTVLVRFWILCRRLQLDICNRTYLTFVFCWR